MTMPKLAERLGSVTAPATIGMSVRARALRGQGHHVISLALGEPDFDTPPHAIAAAHAAALAGETRYPPIDGTAALKRAIADKFRRENGLDYPPEQICVANGGKQILFNALMATLDPGDVVIPAPYWASYPLIVRMLGGVPVFVPCREADGFRLDPAALAGAIGPRTRWVILSSPNNPTGAVYPPALLAALGAVLLHHPQAWILCDEIYERLVFGPAPHASLAQVVPTLRDRVLTLSGVSKTYAMTGWRVGYAGGPAALVAAMVTVQGNSTSGASQAGQAAAAAALSGPQQGVDAMRDTYRRRRDAAVAALRAVPGLSCAVPDGAFYAYPGLAGCIGRTSAGGRRIDTDDDFALALLEERHVAVVAGSAFGLSPFVRLSIAAADADLEEACRRIAAFCQGLAGAGR